MTLALSHCDAVSLLQSICSDRHITFYQRFRVFGLTQGCSQNGWELIHTSWLMLSTDFHRTRMDVERTPSPVAE